MNKTYEKIARMILESNVLKIENSGSIEAIIGLSPVGKFDQNDDDDIVFEIQANSENYDIAYAFTKKNLMEAKINGHIITLNDNTSEVQIGCYKLIPLETGDGE